MAAKREAAGWGVQCCQEGVGRNGGVEKIVTVVRCWRRFRNWGHEEGNGIVFGGGRSRKAVVGRELLLWGLEGIFVDYPWKHYFGVVASRKVPQEGVGVEGDSGDY